MAIRLVILLTTRLSLNEAASAEGVACNAVTGQSLIQSKAAGQKGGSVHADQGGVGSVPVLVQSAAGKRSPLAAGQVRYHMFDFKSMLGQEAEIKYIFNPSVVPASKALREQVSSDAALVMTLQMTNWRNPQLNTECSLPYMPPLISYEYKAGAVLLDSNYNPTGHHVIWNASTLGQQFENLGKYGVGDYSLTQDMNGDYYAVTQQLTALEDGRYRTFTSRIGFTSFNRSSEVAAERFDGKGMNLATSLWHELGHGKNQKPFKIPDGRTFIEVWPLHPRVVQELDLRAPESNDTIAEYTDHQNPLNLPEHTLHGSSCCIPIAGHGDLPDFLLGAAHFHEENYTEYRNVFYAVDQRAPEKLLAVSEPFCIPAEGTTVCPEVQLISGLHYDEQRMLQIFIGQNDCQATRVSMDEKQLFSMLKPTHPPSLVTLSASVLDSSPNIQRRAREKLEEGTLSNTASTDVFGPVMISLPLSPPLLDHDPKTGNGQGRKNVVGMELLKKRQKNQEKCIVYAVGISPSRMGFGSEFEQTMSEAGCETHAFDCTVLPSDRNVANKSFLFHPWCVGTWDPAAFGTLAHAPGVSTEELGRPIFKTLVQIMKELGHDTLDILKFDIEGSEWALLDALLATVESPQHLPQQMLFELHTDGADEVYVPKDLVRGKDSRAVSKLFLSLYDHGYRIVSKEVNRHDPKCAEFTALKVS